jgi:hypothetical protein
MKLVLRVKPVLEENGNWNYHIGAFVIERESIPNSEELVGETIVRSTISDKDMEVILDRIYNEFNGLKYKKVETIMKDITE